MTRLQQAFSLISGYPADERTIISFGLVDPALELGDEIEITWSEAGGGEGKSQMSATEMIKIRAIVSQTPMRRLHETSQVSQRADFLIEVAISAGGQLRPPGRIAHANRVHLEKEADNVECDLVY